MRGKPFRGGSRSPKDSVPGVAVMDEVNQKISQALVTRSGYRMMTGWYSVSYTHLTLPTKA